MKPNIIWLTLESTRFDHTSLSEYKRDTTPNLERIAAMSDAKSFDNCHSNGIWTRSSTASILTGTYPSYHNILFCDRFFSGEIPLLPNILSDDGYETIGFAINSNVAKLCEESQLFDEYFGSALRRNLHEIAGYKNLAKYLATFQQKNTINRLNITKPNTNSLVTKGIIKKISDSQQPFFVYAHYQDTHTPFLPPAQDVERINDTIELEPKEIVDEYISIHQSTPSNKYCPDLTDLERDIITTVYDATLASADRWIDNLLNYIDSNLDNTIVVITADHGELLGENDLFTHYYRAYEAVSHVPLIVLGPTTITDYDGPIQHIDVVRTLLEELGVGHKILQGKDLRNETRDYSVVQRGETRIEANCRSIQEHHPDFESEHDGPLTTINADGFKYEQSSNEERLYQLPDETTDIKSEYPEVFDEFRDRYDEFVKELEQYPNIGENTRDLTQQTKKQLENMGYIVD